MILQVENHRARDAANGNELAKSLEGFIIRKVVKQTIMTSVYGVTNYGAQLQIEGQLKGMFSGLNSDVFYYIIIC